MASDTKIAKRFIAVVGPTASGKSDVAMQLAESLGGEIVCCDSVQLYRGFDIGSAKPSRDDRLRIPHHLFDRFAWDEECDAAIYADEARVVISEVLQRGRVPIVTGGTGLYLRALVGENWDEGLPKDEVLRAKLNERASDDLFTELRDRDPERAKALHPHDRFRVIRALEINILSGAPVPRTVVPESRVRDYLTLIMEPARELVRERIAIRVQKMLELGLVDEVRSLIENGVGTSSKPMQSIGYKECVAYLSGSLSESELALAITMATRQYAKRQATWFKKVMRDITLTSELDLPAALTFLQSYRFVV